VKISSFKRYLPVEGGQTPLYQFWCNMKVKWKCVWKVLKPKIIAALIVITIVITVSVGIIFFIEYLMSQPVDYTKMSLEQQQVVINSGGCCGVSPMVFIAPIMIICGIIGVIGLSIEYLKALAEALKPCIIWEEK
jgi:hypothetical protein